jgi:hypothetical protein
VVMWLCVLFHAPSKPRVLWRFQVWTECDTTVHCAITFIVCGCSFIRELLGKFQFLVYRHDPKWKERVWWLSSQLHSAMGSPSVICFEGRLTMKHRSLSAYRVDISYWRGFSMYMPILWLYIEQNKKVRLRWFRWPCNALDIMVDEHRTHQDLIQRTE